MPANLSICRLEIALVLALTFPAVSLAQESRTRPLDGLSQDGPEHFALVGATVVPRPGVQWDDATIVICQRKIVAAGPDVTTPAEARVIDCQGRFIYAGFLDSYDETDLERIESDAGYWNDQVTPQRSVIRNGISKAADAEPWRRAGFAAKLIAPRGGQIKGTSALVATAVDENKIPIVYQPAAAMHASLTIPFGRRRPDAYPGSPMGALTLVRQALYDAQWYRDAWGVYRAGATTQQPEYNAALDALKSSDAQERQWIIDASNERYALRADRLAREFNLRVILRGSGREYRRLEAIVDTGRGVIVPLVFPPAPDVSTQEAAISVTLERLMHWDLAPENAARLQKAGVPIAFTTFGLKSPAEFWPAIRAAIRRGLNPAAALAAVTTTPAEWFRVDGQLGSIERGKVASLVIADGDLFTDHPKSKVNIIETWVHGQRSRYRWPEKEKVCGTWNLGPRTPDAPEPWQLVIGGRHDKLHGRLSRGDGEPTKLPSVRLNGHQLLLQIPGHVLEREGVVRVSVVLADAQLRDEQLAFGTWPDGSTFQWVAQRVGDEPAATESASQQSAEVDAAKQGESSDRQPPHSEPAAEAEGRRSSHRDVAEPRAALYDVNYPLGAYGREQEMTSTTTVCFRDGTVWTCGSEGTLTEADVLIEEGRVVAVGTDLRVPDATQEIDCRGRHVTPGIIDCHSHIATDGGINEGTQSITAEVRIADFIDADDISIYRQLAGGVTAANILHGSANPIGGQNQVIKLRWGRGPEALKFVEAPAGIKFALGENVKQSNWGDRFTRRYPQSRMGVDELIDDAFRRAAEYAARREQWQRDRQGLPPRVDLELDALAEVLAGTRWIHCHSYRQSEIMALMLTCDRFRVTIGTFQHILEGYKIADEMVRRGIMGSAFSDWWAYKFEVYDAIPYAGALMRSAGVVVSFNSDDPELGRRLNLEAAKAVKYGDVPPEEALKFVTMNPARQLRIDQFVGSLEVGKHADLVVWSGPPLSTRSRCEQTWVDGCLQFDWNDNEMLEARDRERHAALVQRILTMKVPQIKSEDEAPESDALWPRSDIYCHEHPHD